MENSQNLPASEDPFEIDARDRMILQILVDHPDSTNNEIGKAIGVSNAAISKRRNKPAFKKAYADLMSTTDDLMARAQKMSARRLLTLIKDADKKIALEAMKLALSPLMNKHQVDIHKEIIFQTRIGTQGQLMQEVIEVGSKHISDTSDKPSEKDDKQDDPNGKQDKT